MSFSQSKDNLYDAVLTIMTLYAELENALQNAKNLAQNNTISIKIMNKAIAKSKMDADAIVRDFKNVLLSNSLIDNPDPCADEKI